jgi:hypothetical protein
MTGDESAENGGGYRRTRSVSYPHVADRSVDDMSHPEARLVIIRNVGLNLSPWSHFGKADLNSIYRYLTGEFYFPLDEYHTSESPTKGEIRLHIAGTADLSYNPGPKFSRPFNLQNVRNLAYTVRETDDQRPEVKS